MKPTNQIVKQFNTDLFICLFRLRSKPKDRVSSCSNDSGSGAAMSPRPVEGTPTSMKAIMEMTNGSNSSPTSVSRNLFCEKKKKKTLVIQKTKNTFLKEKIYFETKFDFGNIHWKQCRLEMK